MSNRKKIYLHMGFHKTATSSFQETCKQNVELLKNRGIIYPLFNSTHIDIKDIANHSIPIYSMYSEDPKKYHINIRHNVSNVYKLNNDYYSYLYECLNNDLDILLSGEDISIMNEEQLRTLKNILSQRGFLVIPLVVVRSPYEFHCSTIQESVKAGNIECLTKFYSQIEKINNIMKVFPDVKFIPFKTTNEHKSGPVGYLLEKLGLNPDEFRIIRENSSLPNIIVRAQLELNKRHPRILQNKLNENWNSIVNKTFATFKEKFLLTKFEFDELKGEVQKENVFFEDILGEKFKDQNIKFCSEEGLYYEVANLLLDYDPKAKKNSNNCLDESDATHLRDIALKFEYEKQLTLEDAHYLMGLAHKARPEGPVIKQKLNEYKNRLYSSQEI